MVPLRTGAKQVANTNYRRLRRKERVFDWLVYGMIAAIWVTAIGLWVVQCS